MIASTARRRWIKMASMTLAANPIVVISSRALASINTVTRGKI
jgi:hypothetical protein